RAGGAGRRVRPEAAGRLAGDRAAGGAGDAGGFVAELLIRATAARPGGDLASRATRVRLVARRRANAGAPAAPRLPLSRAPSRSQQAPVRTNMPGTASPASPAFRRWRPAAVTAAVLCCVLAGGAGAWALFGPEGGDGGCAGLLRNERVRAALGEAHDSGLGCARLGAEIKKATTGPEQGRHSLRQAQAMKDVLVAVDEELQRPGGRVSRRLFTPLAEALADYPADTEAILGVRSTEYAFKGPPAEPAWRDDEGVHMSVPRTALLRVVRVLSEEPAAYVALRQAATRRAAEGLRSEEHTSELQ